VSRPGLDEYWCEMLPLVASRATCPRRAVGAVLVDKDGRLVSTGYNGVAPGMVHCIDSPCPGHPGMDGLGGPRESCEALHAEANAVAQAFGSNRAPHTLYCSLTPCFACAKLLLACGVSQVVALQAYAHDDAGPRLIQKAGGQVYIWDAESKMRRRHA
jgi:dCMP deaminase